MSLRDQLQKAGVVSAKQAKKAERQKRQTGKGGKQQKPNQITEAKKAAYEENLQIQKAADRARELERRSVKEAMERSLRVTQILENNRLRPGDQRFYFKSPQGSIRRLALSSGATADLAQGSALIVAVRLEELANLVTATEGALLPEQTLRYWSFDSYSGDCVVDEPQSGQQVIYFGLRRLGWNKLSVDIALDIVFENQPGTVLPP